MATFKRFEEIESWKLGRKLTNRIYEVSSEGSFARDFALKDQIRRACVSIMSNIAEGHDRSGTGEFVQFLATAKASAAEVRCQLYIAFDQGYIDNDAFIELGRIALETQCLIGGLMNYLNRSGYKGTKYIPRRKSNEKMS
ncbi:MAG TPA: four helix bundle protein [Pyrinomonadaceae bacterium]|nr:four helix bundle protein [Pyrinomonadaceae bacterium]